jgi:DNA-binding transcriptional ArsR family regulator
VPTEFVSQFSALGQEGRLLIFRLLVRAGPQGLCVDEIKRRVPMPGSTLSHHLDSLERSGLVTSHRASRFIYYAVDWSRTAKLIRFLTEDCCADLHTSLWQGSEQGGGTEERCDPSPSQTNGKRQLASKTNRAIRRRSITKIAMEDQ